MARRGSYSEINAELSATRRSRRGSASGRDISKEININAPAPQPQRVSNANANNTVANNNTNTNRLKST